MAEINALMVALIVGLIFGAGYVVGSYRVDEPRIVEQVVEVRKFHLPIINGRAEVIDEVNALLSDPNDTWRERGPKRFTLDGMNTITLERVEMKEVE